MDVELYSDNNDVARKIWAILGAHTLMMDLHDLGGGYEHEEQIVIRLSELMKITGLKTEDDVVNFLKRNFSENNAMTKMERFLDKHNITYDISSY